MDTVKEHIQKVRADAQQQYSNFSANTRGFANQSMGLIPSLNANDMISKVYNNGKGFIPNNNFVDNCKNCTGGYMKNFDFGDVTDLLGTAASTYTAQQQSQAQEAQAQAAAQIEADKVKEQQAQIALEQAKAAAATSGSGTAVKIIIAVGVVGVVGIAAYFFFKKKKIS